MICGGSPAKCESATEVFGFLGGAPPTRLLVARIDDVPGGRRTTTWEVDHVMWQAGRALPAWTTRPVWSAFRPRHRGTSRRGAEPDGEREGAPGTFSAGVLGSPRRSPCDSGAPRYHRSMASNRAKEATQRVTDARNRFKKLKVQRLDPASLATERLSLTRELLAAHGSLTGLARDSKHHRLLLREVAAMLRVLDDRPGARERRAQGGRGADSRNPALRIYGR